MVGCGKEVYESKREGVVTKREGMVAKGVVAKREGMVANLLLASII